MRVPVDEWHCCRGSHIVGIDTAPGGWMPDAVFAISIGHSVNNGILIGRKSF